jgi:uncharacterized protein (TIGR00255 family)
MIKSMTGFGITTQTDQHSSLTVEIKSLNSKFQDFNLRLPKGLADFELEWRNLLGEKLERGKVTLSVEYTVSGKPEIKQSYNQVLFQAYYDQLKKLADEVGAPTDALFSLALNAPEVIQNIGKEEMPASEKEKIKQAVLKTIELCDQFRKQEGYVLADKIRGNINTIATALKEVTRLDPLRVEKLRTKMHANLQEFIAQEKIDHNRLEQEIIFYIEKLDINEEKVRLQAHLDYFNHIMDAPEPSGKKLGFLAQEIGREINTIGSKANDADIQKQVVLMKEELEKIKEQLNNIL